MNKNASTTNITLDTDFHQNYSLEERVKQAVFSHTEFSLSQIITQDNKQKYYDSSRPLHQHEYLDEVFHMMATLNEQGLHSEDLGKLSVNGMVFRDALFSICEDIASRFGTTPFIYVELGPEPVKTRYIIETLLHLNVKIERYISVDINPASQKHLRSMLSQILPNTQLDFVTNSFEDFRLDEFLGGHQAPALVTMLGFQEGNDDPDIMGSWLSGITRSGDLLLSEVQLYCDQMVANISKFYANPLMQRFSRVAFEQAISPTLPSLNRFFLLPVVTIDHSIINAAVLCEEFIRDRSNRFLFISNYCLKFNKNQYRDYREKNYKFEILGEKITDDQSLIFQLSERK